MLLGESEKMIYYHQVPICQLLHILNNAVSSKTVDILVNLKF